MGGRCERIASQPREGLNTNQLIFSKFNPYRVAIHVAFISTDAIGGYSYYTPSGYIVAARFKRSKGIIKNG